MFGELTYLGPNIFKGYWKNDQATKDSITEDGYFKTGDVGFQDEQHNFYITDRVKELIKYKGFQVSILSFPFHPPFESFDLRPCS